VVRGKIVDHFHMFKRLHSCVPFALHFSLSHGHEKLQHMNRAWDMICALTHTFPRACRSPLLSLQASSNAPFFPQGLLHAIISCIWNHTGTHTHSHIHTCANTYARIQTQGSQPESRNPPSRAHVVPKLSNKLETSTNLWSREPGTLAAQSGSLPHHDNSPRLQNSAQGQRYDTEAHVLMHVHPADSHKN